MEFGRVTAETLKQIDFTLPPDAAGTLELFRKKNAAKKIPQVYVGGAKWTYKDWIGKVYPKGTKDANFLQHYAKRLNCVELNTTFYHIPTVEQVAAWKAKVSKDFKFCPKLTEQITHVKRLNEAQELTHTFVESIRGFGDNLGPVFLQMPPDFAPDNFDALREYAEFLSKYNDVDFFVELRHPAWFSGYETFNSVFSMLEQNNVGAVITDASGRRDCVHMRLTTPVAFIRFVGNNLHPTDYTRCDEWVQRIKLWADQGLEKVYLFMHQHEELYSFELCKYMIGEINKHIGTSLPVPPVATEAQIQLF